MPQSRKQAPGESELAGVVHRNIHALMEVRRQFDRDRQMGHRIADAITRFIGSNKFIGVSALLVVGWLVVNVGWIPGIKPFDPYPFVMLALMTAVEAIFLSTFVLITQNRMSELTEKRAHLNLQINLLAEHEITRLIELTDAIARHLGVVHGREEDLSALKQDVAPEKVLQEIEKAESTESPSPEP